MNNSNAGSKINTIHSVRLKEKFVKKKLQCLFLKEDKILVRV